MIRGANGLGLVSGMHSQLELNCSNIDHDEQCPMTIASREDCPATEVYVNISADLR